MKKISFNSLQQALLSMRSAAAVVIVGSIAGCAVGPDYVRPSTLAAPTWTAPLPHEGKSQSLVNWWSQWNDPILVDLIDNAQRENTTIAQAAARIAQSRANYQSLTALLFPTFTANANDIRSKNSSPTNQNAQPQSSQSSTGATSNTAQRSRNISLDAAWELDVVGGARRGREAAQNRINARNADWHDARVMIAGEVAMQYVNLRTCEVLVTGYEADAKSRAETARLTNLKKDAGFEAPANAALVNASTSEANQRLIQQRAECDIIIKALGELTVTAEPLLRANLAKSRAVIPTPAAFTINAIPAEAISQRPDVASAEFDLTANMADIGVAIADRFPRISLSGVIGYQQFSTSGVDSRGRTWSYGPAISLPIFDAGRRAAEVDVARARYEELLATYKGKTLRAVREVEESLVRLDSAAKREADANAALAGYQKFLTAAEARVKVGAGSLTELEEARRAVVAAQGTAVGVTRERLTAWIGLYKAVGGGWRA
jgi:outer membrane protein, multidrug efflux system